MQWPVKFSFPTGRLKFIVEHACFWFQQSCLRLTGARLTSANVKTASGMVCILLSQRFSVCIELRIGLGVAYGLDKNAVRPWMWGVALARTLLEVAKVINRSCVHEKNAQHIALYLGERDER